MQFMMGSPGGMVTQQPMVKYAVFTKAQQQTKSSFSKGEWLSTENNRALLQNTNGLCCNSCIKTCQRLQTASLSVLPLQAPLNLLDHVAQLAEHLAQQPGPVAEPSLVLYPSQNYQLFRSISKYARAVHSNEEYVPSKIPKGPEQETIQYGVYLLVLSQIVYNVSAPFGN